MYWIIFILFLEVSAQFIPCPQHRLQFECDNEACCNAIDPDKPPHQTYCEGCVTGWEGSNCYWDVAIGRCIKMNVGPPYDICVYVNMFDVNGNEFTDTDIVPLIQDSTTNPRLAEQAENNHFHLGEDEDALSAELERIQDEILDICLGKTAEEISECVMQYVQVEYMNKMFWEILRFTYSAAQIAVIIDTHSPGSADHIVTQAGDIMQKSIFFRLESDENEKINKLREIVQKMDELLDDLLDLRQLAIDGIIPPDKCREAGVIYKKMKIIRNEVHRMTERKCMEYCSQTLKILLFAFPALFTEDNTVLVTATTVNGDKRVWIMHTKPDGTKLHIDPWNNFLVIEKGRPPFHHDRRRLIDPPFDVCCGQCIADRDDELGWPCDYTTSDPTTDPTRSPSTDPTRSPSTDPTRSPTIDPTRSPTTDPTEKPIVSSSECEECIALKGPDDMTNTCGHCGPEDRCVWDIERRCIEAPDGYCYHDGKKCLCNKYDEISQCNSADTVTTCTRDAMKQLPDPPAFRIKCQQHCTPCDNDGIEINNDGFKCHLDCDQNCVYETKTGDIKPCIAGQPATDPTIVTRHPTGPPTKSPSTDPTVSPTSDPTPQPTRHPTGPPTKAPSTDPTKSPSADPTVSPTTDPTKSPTADPIKPPSACNLFGRDIDVIILNDISGPFKDENGTPKASEFRKHQNMVANTLKRLKGSYDGNNELPEARVAYIEYDDDNVHVVIPMNYEPYNQNDDGMDGSSLITDEQIMEYYNLIKERYDGMTDQDLQNKICSNNIKLFTALNEARNQFNLQPKGIDKGRDRYIIIFSNCKVSDSEKYNICDEFEDYIRSGIDNADRGANQNGKGINVVMINMGDEFEDYILCLVEYDDKRIYQSNYRNQQEFEQDGLDGTIVNEICKNHPTAGPTTDPTIDPTSDPTKQPITTTEEQQEAESIFVQNDNGFLDKLKNINNNNNDIWILLTMMVLIVMVFMNIICCNLCIKNKAINNNKKIYNAVDMKEYDVEISDENIPIYH